METNNQNIQPNTNTPSSPVQPPANTNMPNAQQMGNQPVTQNQPAPQTENIPTPETTPVTGAPAQPTNAVPSNTNTQIPAQNMQPESASAAPEPQTEPTAAPTNAPSDATETAKAEVQSIGGLPQNQNELDSYLGIGSDSTTPKNDHQFTPNDLPPLPKEENTPPIPTPSRAKGGVMSVLSNLLLFLAMVLFFGITFVGGYLYGENAFEFIDTDGTYRNEINELLNMDLFPVSSGALSEVTNSDCDIASRYTDASYTDFEFTYDNCSWNFSRTENDSNVSVILAYGDSTLSFIITDTPNSETRPVCYNGSSVAIGENLVRFWDDESQPTATTSIFNYTESVFDESDSRFDTYAVESDNFCTFPTSGFLTDALASENSRGYIEVTLESNQVEDIQSADAIVRTINY